MRLIIMVLGMFSLFPCSSCQYHFVNMAYTWSQAQLYCSENYGDLIPIRDQISMERLINSLPAGWNGPAWIGLYNISWNYKSLNYIHLKGSGFLEVQQADNVNDNEFCVYMSKKKLYKANCEEELYFVCYVKTTTAPATTQRQTMTPPSTQSTVKTTTAHATTQRQTMTPPSTQSTVKTTTAPATTQRQTMTPPSTQSTVMNRTVVPPLEPVFTQPETTATTVDSPSQTTLHSIPGPPVTVGNASVFCNELSMTVSVEKSSIVGLQVDHLRLSDPSCSMNSNSTHIFLTLDLNSCGTQLEEDGDNLIFKNVITYFDDSNDVITREQQMDIDLSCIFPKRGNVNLEFQVHKIPYIFNEKGFGKFTYQFEFFHSSLFNRMVDPASYPVEVELNEMVYMEITSITSASNTEIFVESCRATSSNNPDDPTHYSIIENGCKQDETLEVFPSSRSQFRFGLESFIFIGMQDQVYISCSVILCEAGDPNSRCAEGCINGTSRHRREAVQQNPSHYISQGPLHLRRNANSKVADGALNMNLVFIAGCLLAAVAMVCGVVIYRSRESKVKYQLLPTDQQGVGKETWLDDNQHPISWI